MIAATAAALGMSAAILFTRMSVSTRPKGSSVPAGKDGERRYLIAGNWKCNGTLAENKARVDMFNSAGPIPSNVDVAICAPSIHLPMLLESLRDDMDVGAQDSGRHTKEGAFTGETAAFQMKDLGCVWVIIGHSERRNVFDETNECISAKILKCQ